MTHFKPLADAYHQQQTDAMMTRIGEQLRALYPTPEMTLAEFYERRERLALDIWNSKGSQR